MERDDEEDKNLLLMEKEIIKDLKQQQQQQYFQLKNPPTVLYEDPDFPADNRSLYWKANQGLEITQDEVSWYRPTEYTQDPDYFKNETGCGAIHVGKLLSNNWFLGCAAAVANHPSGLIESLFVSEVHDFKKYGVYTCRFYKDGHWKEVTTDTRLPSCHPICQVKENIRKDTKNPLLLYSRCENIKEVWVSFLEKAYAKYYGCYEALSHVDVCEAMVDLTGGSAKKIKWHDDELHHHHQSIKMTGDLRHPCSHRENNNLKKEDDIEKTMQEEDQKKNHLFWEKCVKHLKWKNILICQRKYLTLSRKDPSSPGILPNSYYTIVHLKEIGNFKFVKLLNPWENGTWNGNWSHEDHSHWTKYPNVENALRNDEKCAFSRKDPRSFWIEWNDFIQVFNEMRITRILPEKKFIQYAVTSKWEKETSGGAPPHHHANQENENGNHDEHAKANLRLHGTSILPDGDPSWFKNPQFKLYPSEKTVILVSLMQKENLLGKGKPSHVTIHFVVMEQNKNDKSIQWEFNPKKIVAEAHSSSLSSFSTPEESPAKEISKGNIVLDPKKSYVIIPYTDTIDIEMEFFLRIFSTKPLKMESLAKPFFCTVEGNWINRNNKCTAGGPLYQEITTGSRSPSWCQNQQYWLQFVKDEVFQPVNLKIIAKRILFTPSFASSHPNIIDSTTTHPESMGMNTTNTTTNENPTLVETFSENSLLLETNEIPIGIVIVKPDVHRSDPTRKSKSSEEKVNFLGEKHIAKVSSLRKSSRGDHCFQKSLEKVVLPPEKKLVVGHNEWCRVSQHKSSTVACLFLPKLCPEWAPNGLLIVPNLGEVSMEGDFCLEVYSDQQVKLQLLGSVSCNTVVGKWSERLGTAPGCHLYSDWEKNPRFLLQLHSAKPVRVKITLSRSELEWGNKDPVGSMMGFYLFQGATMKRDSGNILYEGKPWTQTDFVPMHQVSTPPNLKLDPLINDSYVIMPATWEPKKQGKFLLSVCAECEFTLLQDDSS